MSQGVFGRRLLYWLSVAAGLGLAIVPLPDWLDPVRPDLALLAVINWILTSPRIAGLGYAWLAGIFLDVLRGMVLGQYALAFLVVAFLTHRLQLRAVRACGRCGHLDLRGDQHGQGNALQRRGDR